jgi:hypothetical protein
VDVWKARPHGDVRHRSRAPKMSSQDDDGIVAASASPPFQDDKSTGGIRTSDVHASLASMTPTKSEEANKFFGADPLLSPSAKDNVTLEVSFPGFFATRVPLSLAEHSQQAASHTREHA